MDYITQEDLTGDMPYETIQQALHDGETGVRTPEQVWASVMTKVNQRIHGALRPRFTPPYGDTDGILDAVKDAALIFALETLFNRRPYLQENPYATQSKEALRNLREMGQSRVKGPADSAAPRRQSVTVFSETASSVPTRGRRS
jgi:hypothetical protein